MMDQKALEQQQNEINEYGTDRIAAISFVIGYFVNKYFGIEI